MSGALVLLSGGMDSALVLYEALARHDRVRALLLDYGQRHAFEELWRAERIARSAGIDYARRTIALPWGGKLTESEEVIDDPRKAVVPWRNTFFAIRAVEHAAIHDCAEVWIGCCAADAEAFPDCRPEWLSAMNALLDAGGRAGFRLVAPLIDRTKAQIVRRAHGLGPEAWHALGSSWSCYTPREHAVHLDGRVLRHERRPCRECSACAARARGFDEAGMADPGSAT